MYIAVGTLLTGTYSSVSTKMLYNWDLPSYNNTVSPFKKAYFFALIMFIGEALCLFYKLVTEWNAQRRKYFEMTSGLDVNKTNDLRTPLIKPINGNGSNGSPSHHSSLSDSNGKEVSQLKPNLLVFLILASFDTSATVINGVGLVWVSASANQMFRGSSILFTGVFTIMIFRRCLSKQKWIGIIIVCVGLSLVGVTGVLRGSTESTRATSTEAFWGTLFVLVGSALNAVQGVIEEKLMKGTVVDPLEVVGWEGVFGTLVCLFFVLPIAQVAGAEDTADTLYKLATNAGLTFVVLGQVLALALMNFYSQALSKYLSAIHRNLVSTLRVIVVWIVLLFVFLCDS